MTDTGGKGGKRPSQKATKTREIVLDVLLEVLEKDGFVHDCLRQALEKYQYLEKPDRALITRMAEGTVEYLLTIDQTLRACLNTRLEKLKPVIRTILRMSVYQILWMDRVPDSAVCNEAVKLAAGRGLGGLKGFVNGVLRSVARRKEEFVYLDWPLKYSMPSWIVELWKEQYPDEIVEKMLKGFLIQRPVTVRCNLSLASLEKIQESLELQGVRAASSSLLPEVLLLEGYDYLERLKAFQKGWIQVQDPASALVALAAAPAAGSEVLEVCGAPGGKSFHMADLLKGTGRVTVRDLTEEKIGLVRAGIARVGFSNIQVQVWDALALDESWVEKADIVIADLPCSGLGVIGKKPDIKYRITREKMESLAALQRKILAVASQYVKPGGKLVYSTCTVNVRENQDQRTWFLENFPFVPGEFPEMFGERIGEESLRDGYVQLLPGVHDCDGFFIGVFRKRL